MSWKEDVEFMVSHLTRQETAEITGLSINQVRRLANGRVTVPHMRTQKCLALGRRRLERRLRSRAR